MPTEKITYYQPGAFSQTYHSSIFKDNRMSGKVRELLKPVWNAEDRMRLEMANRINVLLRDRKEPLVFHFNREFKIMDRFKTYTVVGVQSEPPAGHPRDNTRLRRLMIILERDGRKTRSDAMYVCGLNELFCIYEMTLRALWPKEDHPDTPGHCPFR